MYNIKKIDRHYDLSYIHNISIHIRNKLMYISFIKLLHQDIIEVTLDARKKYVKLPKYLKHMHNLKLNISYFIDCQNLHINTYGFSLILSFPNHLSFFVQIPWSSVYRMDSDKKKKTIIIPNHVPYELHI